VNHIDTDAFYFSPLRSANELINRALLIRHLGISEVRPRHLAQAQMIAPVVCAQNPYGVDYRRNHDDFVRRCGGQGVAFVPFFAIAAAGWEAGASGVDSDAVRTSSAHGATPGQVRIAWTLHRGPHVLAVPGHR
jgi:pyridoxine 4-dehydrogenase